MQKTDLGIDYFYLNPLGFHLIARLGDMDIRTIILYGGSSSGKSFSVAQAFLIKVLQDGANALVMRKVGASIFKTIYEDFKNAARSLGIYQCFRFKDGIKQIVCLSNGARIDFSGLDDPEKIKGIANYKRLFLDEWSEYAEEDYKQIRKRLRGMAGQQIVTAFNPISENHWIKKNVFDKEEWHDVPMNLTIEDQQLPLWLTEVKSIRVNKPKPIMNLRTGQMEEHAPDMVMIQSTYLNNFWVVGSPDGQYGFYDEQCIADFEKDRVNDPDYYRIYALGEWGVLRTGSEFFGSFKQGTHTGKVEYNPSYPVHLSVDNNVLPYITTTMWQVITEDGTHIRQFGELCAESPDNTVQRASALVAERLRGLGVDRVYLHGDASTKAANTIDEQKRSWLDLYIDGLTKGGIEVIDCVGNKNPNVAMSGEFINAILCNVYPGIDIIVDDECKVSVDDYLSVQKDMNGAILKTKVKNKITGQTYEEHGHVSDTARYLITDILKNDFIRFTNKRKRNLHADGAIHFYNPQTQCAYSEEFTYCMPNIKGRFVMLHGRKCGDKWHMTDIRFMQTASTEEMKLAFGACGSGRVILECPKSYYIMARELRDALEGDVRVIHESGDLQRRIAAASDYVRDNILFNSTLADENAEYGEFIANMLDYSPNGDNMEGSAALSGFVQAAIKLNL